LPLNQGSLHHTRHAIFFIAASLYQKENPHLSLNLGGGYGIQKDLIYELEMIATNQLEKDIILKKISILLGLKVVDFPALMLVAANLCLKFVVSRNYQDALSIANFQRLADSHLVKSG
jgi:hypothetical protein